MRPPSEGKALRLVETWKAGSRHIKGNPARVRQLPAAVDVGLLDYDRMAYFPGCFDGDEPPLRGELLQKLRLQPGDHALDENDVEGGCGRPTILKWAGNDGHVAVSGA